jgi:hypothetical protein
MSDKLKPNDPGAVWRGQSEEKPVMDIAQFADRRGSELHAATRSEILMSVAVALLFVAVMAWRFAPDWDRLLLAALGLMLVWAALTLYRFRDRLRRQNDFAVPGLDFYRRELQRRRDHLRNVWLWHGPLVLACLVFVVTVTGKVFPGTGQLRRVWPLVLLLAVWTAVGVWRRLKLARAIQREIDELNEGNRP